MKETQSVIDKGQPWKLPAHLTEEEITVCLDTDDWDYALPRADADFSVIVPELMAAIEQTNQMMADLKAQYRQS